MKKIITILMVICLAACALCVSAFAADDPAEGTVMRVGAQKKDGTIVKIAGGDFDNFEEGWEAAVDYAEDHDYMETNGYNRIVVDFFADWNANEDGEFGSGGDGFEYSAIHITKDIRITLNLNGHTIDRKLKEAEADGEVIYIDENADVIINSGTIKGGYSDNGAGGLHIKSDAKVTLNNVNIVGNAVKNDDGAAIAMYGDSVLVMNGGSISDNFMAGSPYGALYVNGATAKLSDVTISGNYTYSYDARGLAIYATDSIVKMDNCTVSNNATRESVAEDIIYADDSSLIITDTDFTMNNLLKAPSGLSDFTPRLFYIEESNLTLMGGNITQNGSVDLFFFSGSEADIKSVTITDNKAKVVYVKNNSEIVNMIECTLNNNTPEENWGAIMVDKRGTLVMTDCTLGDTTFYNFANVKITTSEVSRDEGVIGISLLGEGGTSVSVRYYKDFASGWNYAIESAKTNAYDRVVVDLYADWNIKDAPLTSGYVVSIPENARVTINMNSHAIDRTGADTSFSDMNGEVVYIGENADVIINDGKITGGKSAVGAGGIHINNNARVILNNVNVEGNQVTGANGAAIAVYNGAVLIMNGGSLSDNFMTSKVITLIGGIAIPICSYGTLYVEDATAMLNGVVINNNCTDDSGSEGVAIYVNDSTVTLNNCVVSGNAVDDGKAGEGTLYACSVIGAEGSTLVIKNSDFTDNGSLCENGDFDYTRLFDLEDSGLTLEGGKITGNSPDKLFLFDDSEADIKGVTITDNTSYVFDIENGSEKVTVTECTLNKNTSVEYDADILVEEKDTLVMNNCTLGDTSFKDKSMVIFTGKTVGSIFGEGSLTMILVIVSLVASAVSICLTVALYKKKAVPAAANNAEKTENE